LESRIHLAKSRCIRIQIYPDISGYISDVPGYIPDVSGQIWIYLDISGYIPDLSGYIWIYLYPDTSGFIWIYPGFQGWEVPINLLVEFLVYTLMFSCLVTVTQNVAKLGLLNWIVILGPAQSQPT
jgi:hypothetical protein